MGRNYGRLHRRLSHSPTHNPIMRKFTSNNTHFSPLFFITAISSLLLLPNALSITPALAAPDPNQEITMASIEAAMQEGKVNQLISMIAQSDQDLVNSQNEVEREQQKVNEALVKAQAAQNRAREAGVSVKGASQDQIKAQQEVDTAKQNMQKLIKQAYESNVDPSTIMMMESGKDFDTDVLDKSSLLALLAHRARVEYDALVEKSNAFLNINSIAVSSKIQAEAAAQHAEQERKNAQQTLADSLKKMNANRDKKRELELQRSLAQAAYDSARAHVNDAKARATEYQTFKQALATRLVHESPTVVKSGPASNQTPFVSVLSKVYPLQLSIPQMNVLNSIPLVKDLPGVGLLTGAKSIDPAALALDGVQTFVKTTMQSGDPISNVISGTVQGVEVPADGISQALGLESLGIPGLHRRFTPGAQNPFLRGSAGVEAVVSRGMSVIGTPYAWGGGSLDGPTKGIHDGGVADSYGDYNKVGFDCSGLMMYAFAAAGIHLPHYSGYQYNSGPKYPLSQMRRGDMIFYGPGGSQHVALILGDGTMLEAPESGSTVHVSQVRTAGAVPYVVRMLE